MTVGMADSRRQGPLRAAGRITLPAKVNMQAPKGWRVRPETGGELGPGRNEQIGKRIHRIRTSDGFLPSISLIVARYWKYQTRDQSMAAIDPKLSLPQGG